MNKKTVKLTQVILIPGKFQSSKVDGVWAGNLNFRLRNGKDSYYCWIPPELGGICAKKITIELAEPKTFETLTSKKRRQQDTAKYIYAKSRGLIEDFSGSSQDDEIKLLDLMHLLGVPDERILGGDAPVFEDLKVKLQELGARWYNYDVKKCKKDESFSVDDSVQRFIKDSRTESKMKEAGLNKDEIADNEMIEAVMRKIIDEQLEPYRQNYGKAEIDKEHRKTQQKYKKAKHKSKGSGSKKGKTMVKAEKYSRKEQAPEEKEEIAEAAKRLKQAKGGDKHE